MIRPTQTRPFLQGSLHRVDVPFLYDTGSAITCISENVFRRLSPDLRPEKLPMMKNSQFQSAGGQQLKVRGLYNLPLQILGKTITHPTFVISDLNENGIIGIDFINQHKLNYDTQRFGFYWNNDKEWYKGILRSTKSQKIEALSNKIVHVNLITEFESKPENKTLGVATITNPERPWIMGGPALIESDKNGQCYIEVINSTPVDIEISRNEFLGVFENVTQATISQMEPEKINAIARNNVTKPVPLNPDKREFILKNANVNVPQQFKDQYIQLLLKHHSVFSIDKNDLGRSDLVQHKIHLKNNEPVYIKQFKIPDAHMKDLENQVSEWLKLGIVQPSRSTYNSPLFLVTKKDGGLRVVQDFRALNANSFIDKYTMKDIQECISEIGRSHSNIFSTLDLTSGFWQMVLSPESRQYTAFTLTGKGQFEWVTSPMGLLGCPASFQRLVEAVVQGLKNILVYIDDLLVHSSSHPEHLKQLDSLFERLKQHNLKINLKKCLFGSTSVSYLGFQLTPQGIKPGKDKLKAVGAAPPPTDVRQIKQFLGLCNFFRNLVKNFAQITAPLTNLTKKSSGWKGGELPPEALTAFRTLQTKLCSEPILSYPRRDRHYCLITDAALGDENNSGGFGAILTQIDKTGDYHVISYASRKLVTHEKNYAPFLLEMQAACWAMDHYDNYLRGRPFTLMTDHKPLCELGKVHTRTLNRLQEMMNLYNFDIVYKKGEEMPSDYLSRNAIDSITFEGEDLISAQENDSLIGPIKRYLLNRELPTDIKTQNYIRHYALDCFIENDILWRRIDKNKELNRVVLFAPQSMIHSILKDAHGSLVGGHDGTLKTKERILKCYFWPGMDRNINDFINSCEKCQLRKKGPHVPQALLSPLPQCSEPNQRIHVDLFGPLRTSGNGKKYILCVTDAFTKYVELIAIPDKEAKTVTSAILHKWICRFGLPLEILSDMGGEFRNKLSASLWEMLGTTHTTTSPRHPQCNAQCEIANKTIAKYLSSYVNQDTLDWEVYLAPLMLYYNTSFHRSIKTSPFFLTFGVEPRLPNFPEPDLRRKFYGESDADELKLRLLRARQIAYENNLETTEKAKEYFDKKVKPTDYKLGQYVLLDEHSFLGKNTKLAPKYSGPHKIIRLKGGTNAELLLKNNKKVIVHFDRLKPFTFPQDDKKLISEKLVPTPSDIKLSQQDKLEVGVTDPPTHAEDELDVERIPDRDLFRAQLQPEAPKQRVRVARPPQPPRKAVTRQRVARPPPTRPPPPKPPVEQGGIASRTRSRVQERERGGGQGEQRENDMTIEQTGPYNFDDVNDEFAPDISPIKKLSHAKNRSYLGKIVKRGNQLAKTRSLKTKAHLELKRQIQKYLNPHPASRKLVYSGGLDVPVDPFLASDSSSSDSDLDPDPDPPAGGLDTDYASLESDSDTEVEGYEDSEDEATETETEPVPGPAPKPAFTLRPATFNPGGATGGTSPKKKVTTPKESKLDKLLQKTDEFLYSGYPKRNIPKKNYKE